MRRTTSTLARLVLTSLLAAVFLIPFSPAMAADPALDLRLVMRKLWEDHVQWTRYYIVSAAADLPGTDATAARLMQNQTDIGNAIMPYYGEDAGNQLTSLLKEHIQGAVEVLAEAKAGDSAKLESANAAWYANADQIATFLAAANPASWPADTMKAKMKMHLDLTLAEASAHLEGDHAADVAAYDKVHEHILALADTLSAGIRTAGAGPVSHATAAAGQASIPSILPRTGSGPADGGEVPLLLAVAALLACGGVALLLRRPRAPTD